MAGILFEMEWTRREMCWCAKKLPGPHDIQTTALKKTGPYKSESW